MKREKLGSKKRDRSTAGTTLSSGGGRKLTPIKAIRKTCFGCCAGATEKIGNCQATACPLFEYRLGKRPRKGTAKRTPQQAIKAYYLELQGRSKQLVREDPLGLPCDQWRFGKRPPVEETYYDEADELEWFPWKRAEQERVLNESELDTSEKEKTPEVARGSEPNAGHRDQGEPSKGSHAKRGASPRRKQSKPRKREEVSRPSRHPKPRRPGD